MSNSTVKPCKPCRATSDQAAWSRYKNGEADGNECANCRNYFKWKFRGDRSIADKKKKFIAVLVNDDDKYREWMEGDRKTYMQNSEARPIMLCK